LNWNSILIIFAMSIAIFIAYSFANSLYLSKLKANKWVVLGVSIVFLLIGLVLPLFSTNIWVNYIPTAIFVFFFLWYADLSGLSNVAAPKAAKPREIKPKAKPNKLKYVDEKDIVKLDTKKEKSKLFKKKSVK